MFQQHFVLVVKISRKNLLKKMENNSTLEKILWVFNRNAELLRLVAATFSSKVACLRRMMKKNLIILKSLQKRKLLLMAIFYCLWPFELSNINWKCSEHIYMLTEHTYDSAVFEIFLNIITYIIFYWTIINWNFICEILFSIMAFIEIYTIKVSVWTRYNVCEG